MNNSTQRLMTFKMNNMRGIWRGKRMLKDLPQLIVSSKFRGGYTIYEIYAKLKPILGDAIDIVYRCEWRDGKLGTKGIIKWSNKQNNIDIRGKDYDWYLNYYIPMGNMKQLRSVMSNTQSVEEIEDEVRTKFGTLLNKDDWEVGTTIKGVPSV